MHMPSKLKINLCISEGLSAPLFFFSLDSTYYRPSASSKIQALAQQAGLCLVNWLENPSSFEPRHD